MRSAIESRHPAKTALAVTLFLLILLVFHEVFRRNPIISLAIFLVLPIVLFPYWRNHAEHSLFGWVKLYSIAMGVTWFTLLRYTPLQNFGWAFFIAYLILILNILEAVILDISKKQVVHYLNAAAGIILIFTASRTMGIDNPSGFPDLVWFTPLHWIVAYTIWNIVMVYLHTPQHFGMHTAVLGSALIIGLIDHTIWVQARAYTLGIFFLLFFTQKPMFDALRTPAITNRNFAFVGSVTSLVLAVSLIFLG